MKSKFLAIGLLLVAMSVSSNAATNNTQNNQNNLKPMNQMDSKSNKEELYAKLSLTTEQKIKLDSIFNEFENNMKNNPPKNGGEPPKKEDMDAKIDALNLKVKAILSEAQFEIYKTSSKSLFMPPSPKGGQGNPNN